MPAVGRRAFLVTGLAAATAACGRAHPSASTEPVTEFLVTAPGRPTTALTKGLTAAQQLSALTANASASWRPVVQAFNEAHPHLRAMFGPAGVDPTSRPGELRVGPNPALSCQVGVPLGLGGADLSSTVRDANLDAAALLPAMLAAASDRQGAIRGIPMDFSLMVTAYDTATLLKAHLSPPPTTGWTGDQFTAAVDALAQAGRTATTFGLGLAAVSGGGQAAAWFGFAEGYGGRVFGSRVTLASGPVYEGLKAYAAILKVTWTPAVHAIPLEGIGLGFGHLEPTLGTKPWSEIGRARFPRLPVPAVPADVLVAEVPVKAPHPKAGATFAVWLATAQGQKALTALGYPPVRVDAPGGTAPAWAANAAIRPSDLRFRPGGLFGFVDGSTAAEPIMGPVGFDRRIALALLQPETVRLSRLRSLEQALTGVLNGSLTRQQASVMLDREGVAVQ